MFVRMVDLESGHPPYAKAFVYGTTWFTSRWQELDDDRIPRSEPTLIPIVKTSDEFPTITGEENEEREQRKKTSRGMWGKVLFSSLPVQQHSSVIIWCGPCTTITRPANRPLLQPKHFVAPFLLPQLTGVQFLTPPFSSLVCRCLESNHTPGVTPRGAFG
jgi:hypothetical protein